MLLTLVLSIFASTLGAGLIAPILPLYAEGMGATGLWVGIVFASFSISRTALMPALGKLSDRWGRKPFICSGLLVCSLISLGYVGADGVEELTLVRLAHGAAVGAILPIAQAYVGELAPGGKEGTLMGYFNASFFAGFGFGPLMGGALVDSLGMRAPFYGMGALNLLAFLFVGAFLPELKAKASLGLKRMRGSRVMKGLFSFRLVYAFGRGIFASFLPIFASTKLGLTPSQTGALITANILVVGVLHLPFGRLADRFSRRGLVVGGGLIAAGSLFLIPLSGSFWHLLGLCLIGALGGSLSLPAGSAMGVDEGRRYGMGFTLSILTMGMGIGMGAGPILGGGLMDALGVASAFYLAGVVETAGVMSFIWFTKSIIPGGFSRTDLDGGDQSLAKKFHASSLFFRHCLG